jgi:NADH dehydrogenase
MGARKNVLILGAGFGGVHVALELARRASSLDITLVAERNFLLYTPMLTELVAGEVDPRHIVWAARKISPHVRFVSGRVTAVDLADKSVTLAVGEHDLNVPEAARTVRADELVIALGSTTQFHDIPGLQEHALTVTGVADAGRIRIRALALLERAAVEPDRRARGALLTFVVGGGGFSGVETMAGLNDLVRDAGTYCPAIPPGSIRMLLCHHGDRLLPELGGGLARYAQQELERRGVEVRLQTSVTSAGADYVALNHDERIPTRLLIWTGGETSSPVVETLDCEHGKNGGIVVDHCCRVVGHPGVWAVGDCAEVPTPNGTARYAPTAQNAVREGRLVGQNIAAKLQGRGPRPLTYRPIGELALVGRRAGVASVYGFRFSGTLAWAMWRATYLAKMPGRAKRVRILIDWLFDLAFGIDIADLPVTPEARVPSVSVAGGHAHATSGSVQSWAH